MDEIKITRTNKYFHCINNAIQAVDFSTGDDFIISDIYNCHLELINIKQNEYINNINKPLNTTIKKPPAEIAFLIVKQTTTDTPLILIPYLKNIKNPPKNFKEAIYNERTYALTCEEKKMADIINNTFKNNEISLISDVVTRGTILLIDYKYCNLTFNQMMWVKIFLDHIAFFHGNEIGVDLGISDGTFRCMIRHNEIISKNNFNNIDNVNNNDNNSETDSFNSINYYGIISEMSSFNSTINEFDNDESSDSDISYDEKNEFNVLN